MSSYEVYDADGVLVESGSTPDDPAGSKFTASQYLAQIVAEATK